MTSEATTSDEPTLDPDEELKVRFGYTPRLRRKLGAFGSFMLAYSMITITTTIFTLFAVPFQSLGGWAIWLWWPVLGGVLGITRIYGHLASRLAVTGYAYQWSARIVSPSFGWFSGWNAFGCTLIGTAGIAVALASVFAPDVSHQHQTHTDIALLAIGAILAAAVINILGIRVAKWVNNVGGTMELVGTLGFAAALGVGLIFFHGIQGPRVLFQAGSSNGSQLSFGAIGLALLLPVYTLAGEEGSADLAEETRDPHLTVPRAMTRAVLISGIAAFCLYAIFAMAIPGNIAPVVNGAANPMIAIFQAHYGVGPADALQVIAFAAMFSALVCNMAVAGRTGYSLARDNMLPFSGWFGRVNERTRTPISLIVVVAAFAILVNVLAAGVATNMATNVISVVNVALYLTYGSTCVAVLIGHRRRTIPDAPPQYYSLGRWLVPVTVAVLVFCVIVFAFTVGPASEHVVLKYAAGYEAIGAVWYLAALRRRLRAGQAGPHATEQQPD